MSQTSQQTSRPMVDDVEVVGLGDLIAKQSAVTAEGRLRTMPIEGVQFRPARPVPHEDGHVTEVARGSWGEIDQPIVQVHTTTTFAGRVRAWGLHQRSTDRLFVVRGLVKIAVFDGRKSSSSYGRLNLFTVSEQNPGLLVIPPNLYHGWKNIGIDEAIIINMPTSMYDYEAPDALDLPYDAAHAETVVPFRF